jgi:hypothetical protein
MAMEDRKPPMAFSASLLADQIWKGLWIDNIHSLFCFRREARSLGIDFGAFQKPDHQEFHSFDSYVKEAGTMDNLVNIFDSFHPRYGDVVKLIK